MPVTVGVGEMFTNACGAGGGLVATFDVVVVVATVVVGVVVAVLDGGELLG